MQVQVKILDSRAAVPAQGTLMSAGYDLIACVDQPVRLIRGAPAQLIPTGLAMLTNDAAVAGVILPRSGLGHKQGLILGNTLGLVDGDYQGQWFVSAWNRGQEDIIVINPGDRIAQAIFIPVLHPEFVQVESFEVSTERGECGFGSTGVTTDQEANVALLNETVPVAIDAPQPSVGSLGEEAQ
jgi:dUTP pyrophosphatase